MTYFIALNEPFTCEWINERVSLSGFEGPCSTIAVLRDGEDGYEIAAAAMFSHYSGWNVQVHLAIDDRHATALLFTLIGRYVFEQLALGRLTILVLASNLHAVRLYERLGAVQEGKMLGAGQNGDDILIFRLTRDCVFWRRSNEQRRRRPGCAELSSADSTAGAGEHSPGSGRRGDQPDEYRNPLGQQHLVSLGRAVTRH